MPLTPPVNRGSSRTSDKRTYRQTVQFTTNSPIDEAQVLDLCGYATGQPHPSNPNARLKQIDANQTKEDGKNKWLINLNYDTEATDEDQQNPIEAGLDVSTSSEDFQYDSAKDREGTAVLNSAKDKFADVFNLTDSILVINITRNEPFADFSLSDVFTYENHTNEGAWWGFAAGWVLCSKISAQLVRNKEFGNYWRVTYTFKVKGPPDPNPNGIDPWDVEIQDMGMNEVVAGEKQKIRIKGQETSVPQPLNGAGVAAAVGADPVYKKFVRFTKVSFGPLDLDLADL